MRKILEKFFLGRKSKADMPKIDLVCCWVTLDEDYQNLLAKYKGHSTHKQGLSQARFRELGELTHSIPAALKFLPWLNKIYIVTNGQKPPAAVLNLPKVEHVTHADIFRHVGHLPTFNYHAIESNLCFIPGLSDYFINTNDDFFIGKPLTPDYFLGKKGVGTFLHTRHKLVEEEKSPNVWQANLSRSEQLLREKYGMFNRYQFPHAPQLYMTKVLQGVWDEFGGAVAKTSASKFRSFGDCLIRILYSHKIIYENYGLGHYEDLVAQSDGDLSFVSRKKFIHIRLSKFDDPWQRHLEEVKEKRPTFFCLNDNIPASQYDQVADEVTGFLTDYYADTP